MKKLLVFVVLSLFVPVSFAAGLKFNDVSEGAWYEKAIDRLADKGLIQGYEDGSFGPNNTITRAEVAVMFDRLIGSIGESQFNLNKFLIPGEGDDAFELGYVSAYVFDQSVPRSSLWIDSYELSDNILTLEFRHGAGCGSFYNYDLVWDGKYYGVDGDEVYLYVDFQTDELCEALGRGGRDYNLKNLKNGNDLVLIINDKLNVVYPSDLN